MANKELSLDLQSAGGSSVRPAGGEESSLTSCTAKNPCTGAKNTGFSQKNCATAAEEAFAGEEEIAPKRKAPAAGLDGCAPKRRGEEVEEEALPTGELEWDEDDLDHTGEVVKARFHATMERLFGNNPSVEWVDFPDCCVRPPGVYFPKPSDRRPPYGQKNLAKKEEDAA